MCIKIYTNLEDFMKRMFGFAVCFGCLLVMLTSCLSMFGVKKLDLATVEPNVQIGSAIMRIQKGSNAWRLFVSLYGDGEVVTADKAMVYFIDYFEKNVDIFASKAREKGIILDVDRLRRELLNSTVANFDILEDPVKYGKDIILVQWKASSLDTTRAGITFGFAGERDGLGFKDGVLSIGRVDPETKEQYAAIIPL
jgi:hypothetical protein